MASELIKKIENLIQPALEELGLKSVDITYNRESQGMVLRIYVEKVSKEEKVTLSDCERASEKIGFLLDKEDLISGSYSLEVSSPGVYRRLKKEEDFIRFTGERIKVTLYEPIPVAESPDPSLTHRGRYPGGMGTPPPFPKGELPVRRNFTGILKKFENNKIYIEVSNETRKQNFEIDISNIASASLEPDLKI
ncbi:MAG: ribosome maturation factor RimP [Elusimicrobiota bacterium]